MYVQCIQQVNCIHTYIRMYARRCSHSFGVRTLTVYMSSSLRRLAVVLVCGPYMQVPGCEGSGMMMAFHQHLMQRLNIPQDPIDVR